MSSIIFGFCNGWGLLNTLNIAYNSKEKCDLLISLDEENPEERERIERLREINLFDKIYIVDSKKRLSKIRWGYFKRRNRQNKNIIDRVGLLFYRTLFYVDSIFTLLMPKRTLKKVEGFKSLAEKKYDKMYIGMEQEFERAFYIVHKRNHGNITALYFGHGLETYIYESLSGFYLNYTFSKKIFEAVIGEWFLDNNIRNCSLINSKFRTYSEKYNNDELRNLLKVNKDEINKIICYDSNFDSMQHYKYIYLKTDAQNEDFIIEKVIEIVGQNNLIVKEHVSKELHHPQKIKYKVYEKNIMFEAIPLNFDLDDQVIITTFSSAAFSPKILFDQEPYIILTYKLSNSPVMIEAANDGKTHRFIDNFKKHYNNKDRIIIPNDFKELEKALLYINSAIQKPFD